MDILERKDICGACSAGVTRDGENFHFLFASAQRVCTVMVKILTIFKKMKMLKISRPSALFAHILDELSPVIRVNFEGF